ncbi:MAG: C39 family peptidase [Ruminococcus sp.]|nr:C39 family peptidase [Ruminococcus sp.]
MKFIKRIFTIFFFTFLGILIFSSPVSRHVHSKEPEILKDSVKLSRQEDVPIVTVKKEEEPKGHAVPITMYSQHDPAWSSYLYGGIDPMTTHGCGPTALAMAVSSLSDTAITPVDAAQWSATNGCYSPNNGSVHALIPNGAASYGLRVEKLSQLTPDAFRSALSFDKLLVLLMGPGDFSDSGHFIIAYGYDENGSILVADPASEERSSMHWSAEVLISQLSTYAKNGGPVWVLSKPE